MTDEHGPSVILHLHYYVIVRLVGQSLSALCTSSLQNVSAVGSSHSLSETMLFLSLTLFGLVSSEHNGTSLILVIGSVSATRHNARFFTVTTYIIY